MNRSTRQQTSLNFADVILGLLFCVLAFLVLKFFFEFVYHYLLPIAITTETNKLIVSGGYFFFGTIVAIIIFSGIRKAINRKREIHAFYNSRATWRFTWLLGGLFSYLGYLLDHHLLFLNWYFIVVGFIPLLNSLYKYAAADLTGLTLYYGIFLNRKKIKFDWCDIADIGIARAKKVGKVSAGSKIWVSQKEEYEVEAFRIQFKKPLPRILCENLNSSNKGNVFVNEYHINEQRDQMILKTEPQIGFDHFEYALRRFISPADDIQRPYPRFVYLLVETFWSLIMITALYMPFFFRIMLLPA